MCASGPPTSRPSSDSDRPILHQELIDRGVSESSIWTHSLCHESQNVSWLRDRYQEIFGLAQTDFHFLDGLMRLRQDGTLSYTDGGTQYTHYLPQGHSWLVQFLNPDIDLLMRAELIRYPRINGDERKRVLSRTFYELTPSGRDIVEGEITGEGVGDQGEGIVHKLGVWLSYWHCVESFGEHSHESMPPTETKRYHNVEGAVFDLAVAYVAGDEKPGTKQSIEATIEVEADSKHIESTINDAYKMGGVARETLWVFPTREVLAETLQALSLRGLTGLDENDIPDTLAVRNHRDTYNTRLEDAPVPRERGLNFHPIRQVATYKGLADELKEIRPELLYGTSRSVEER